jgi:hypothetical protein
MTVINFSTSIRRQPYSRGTEGPATGWSELTLRRRTPFCPSPRTQKILSRGTCGPRSEARVQKRSMGVRRTTGFVSSAAARAMACVFSGNVRIGQVDR